MAVSVGSWSAALAAPPAVVGKGPNFVVIEDRDGSLDRTDWYGWSSFQRGFKVVHDAYYATEPDNVVTLITFQTFVLRNAGGFFQHVANNVRGIGLGHIVPREVPAEIFDATPDTKLEGFINLGLYSTYFDNPTRLSLVFNQEVGHAWGAFVWFRRNGQSSQALIGREGAHWSFYVHTAGSAVQGNDWHDNGDGTFTTKTKAPYVYSDLDLYLMGLCPKEEVRPFFYIENPESVDGTMLRTTGAGPTLTPYTVRGQRVDVSVDDVIAAEGARLPAYGEAAREFPVGVAIVMRAGETLHESEAEMKRIADLVETARAGWEAATRGRGKLRIMTGNRTRKGDGEPCGHDDHCQDGLRCQTPVGRNGKTCASACPQSPGSCAAGGCCLPTTSAERACFPAPVCAGDSTDGGSAEGGGSTTDGGASADGGSSDAPRQDGGLGGQRDAGGTGGAGGQSGEGGGCSCRAPSHGGEPAPAGGVIALALIGICLARRSDSSRS